MKSILKKVIIAVVGLFAIFKSDYAAAEFRYGPIAGVDFTTLKFKQKLFDVNSSVGGSAGIMAEMMFPGVGFGLDFGLNYELRGAKLHLDQRELWASQGYTDPQCSLHYVVLPLHLRFKYTRLGGLEETFAPFIYAGPSFGFLAGHTRIKAMNFAGAEVGVDFGVGVELFQRLQLTGSWTWGISRAVEDRILTDFTASNSTWAVKVAWLF